MPAQERNRQTPGQARSRPGKIARKQEKRERLRAEAAKRGVSPIDILQERALQMDHTLSVRAQRAAQEERESKEAVARRASYYRW